MTKETDHRQRKNICPGDRVKIVLKQHQQSGRLTEGRIAEILTNTPFHSHGIKVQLIDGSVGRVREICLE